MVSHPRYLWLHAAVCRVAHMSGAAQYLDLFDEELETNNVLAPHLSFWLLNFKKHFS